MSEPALAVGTLVDYCSESGETTPAVIAKIVDDAFSVVELAVPPHIGDGYLSAVPFNDTLAYGAWTWQPKIEKKWGELVNPYGLTEYHKHWFSASEVKQWQLCKRKWGYRYLEKIKGQNRFAKRGTATHGFIEGWLKYGIAPPEHIREGKLARKGLKHLPPPTAAVVERQARYLTRGGFQYSMGIDCSFIDADTGRVVVLDHKTITDFKWAMTAEQLEFDIQGLLYAAESFIYWGTPELDLRWLYYKDLKNKPTCRKVEAPLDIETVEARLDAVDDISREIVLHGLSKTTAEELPVNGLACEQYGGCPYRESGHCTIKDEDILEAYVTQSSIRERLMSKGTNGAAAHQEAKAAEVVQQKAAPVANPTPAAAAGAPSALQRLRQNAGTAPTAAAPKAAPVQTKAAPQPTANKPVAGPMGALSRLAAQANGTAAPAATPAAAAAGTAPGAVAARVAARRVTPAPQPVETAPETTYEEPPATFDTESEFAPEDVNPPEQPENPIHDAAELNAANEAAAPVVPKKGRGRPQGSVTIKPLGDEGQIFAMVFCKGFELGMSIGDEAPDEFAAMVAKTAVEAFRKL